MLENKKPNRRDFMKTSVKGAIGATLATVGFPTIVPAAVFGPNAPSNRINIGAIGLGRISREHDMFETLKYNHANIMAVCDVDSKRLKEGKQYVNDYYTKKYGKPYDGVKMYGDAQELLNNKDIDAVLISTPDHSHAYLGVLAAEARKDIYLQKPTALTIHEGRALSNAVHKQGCILQIGSQQRSSSQFRYAAELVRNGRIGKLKEVLIGLPKDPSGEVEPEMPIPSNLNYNAWIGPTPYVYYTEKRVHPQNDYSRPGWMRGENYCAGMITNWGAHHIDCAHWAMNTEYTGPKEVWGNAVYPTSGLWDVMGDFTTYGLYENGVKMTISTGLPNGIKYIGAEGWIFVTRGAYKASASDPVVASGQKALTASNDSIITSVIGENEVNLYRSDEHHGNWLDCVKSRKQPIAPVEVGHRSCSTCIVHSIAMKTKRKLYWNATDERFINDDEANGLLNRPHRTPYTIKGLS